MGCTDRPRQDCFSIVRRDCSLRPKAVSRLQCREEEKEICIPVSETKCENVSEQVCLQVPSTTCDADSFVACGTVETEVCRVPDSEECSVVETEVCNKAVPHHTLGPSSWMCLKFV